MQTRGAEVSIFAENLRRIALVTDQTVAHRKKFEYALSQLRKIANRLATSGDQGERLSQDELAAAKALSSQLEVLRNLMVQHLIQTWSIPTIENSCNHVLDQLLEIFKNVKDAFEVLDKGEGECVSFDPQQWIQYHVLDIRAIATSLSQYLKMDDVDSELEKSIQIRLASINRTLEQTCTDVVPNRVFSPVPVNYQSWRVHHADYEKLKNIGSGVSATVFLARDRKTNEQVAIKEFRFRKLENAELREFRREVGTLAMATHPTLLKLRGATDSKPYCIVTDWMPHSTLYHDLHRYHRLDATGRTIAAFDIARGMQFLHSCQIIHRDLKSLNILLDAENRIRICDFGFSRRATEDVLMTQNIGTPHWMAPEILATSTVYSSKVDVYSYGIVLWEIATGEVPYNSLEPSDIIGKVLANDLRPTIPIDLNPGMRDLIKQCWDRNPDVRPSFDEIVKRIQSGEAVYNGTNMDELAKYIRENATSGERLRKDVEAIIKKIEDGEISLGDATNRLTTTTIPPDVIDRAWKIVPVFADRFTIEEVTRYLSLFLKTSKMTEAAVMLRQMPPGSVPMDVINKFITEIPTGSVEADTNIVVAGCRNGAADLCAVYATNPTDVALAFDVVARVGVSIQLKTALCDRCVQSIGKMDAVLATSAIRCLLSIGEFKRIPVNALKCFTATTNQDLNRCAYMAIAVMAKHGKYPPIELFEVLITKCESDDMASAPLIMACKSEDLAQKLMSHYELETPPPTETTLKALICAARFNPLRETIKKVLEKVHFSEDRLISPLNSLMEKLNKV